MYKLNILSKSFCDAAILWQFGFQDLASHIVAGIYHIHNHIIFYFNMLKNPHIKSTKTHNLVQSLTLNALFAWENYALYVFCCWCIVSLLNVLFLIRQDAKLQKENDLLFYSIKFFFYYCSLVLLFSIFKLSALYAAVFYLCIISVEIIATLEYMPKKNPFKKEISDLRLKEYIKFFFFFLLFFLPYLVLSFVLI